MSKVMEGHERSLNVFFHQIDISSEKSYGWFCAVGYVGGYGGHRRSWKKVGREPSPGTHVRRSGDGSIITKAETVIETL